MKLEKEEEREREKSRKKDRCPINPMSETSTCDSDRAQE